VLPSLKKTVAGIFLTELGVSKYAVLLQLNIAEKPVNKSKALRNVFIL
jgi:hypothetical protein